jgi:hypothetical protein
LPGDFSFLFARANRNEELVTFSLDASQGKKGTQEALFLINCGYTARKKGGNSKRGGLRVRTLFSDKKIFSNI